MLLNNILCTEIIVHNVKKKNAKTINIRTLVINIITFVQYYTRFICGSIADTWTLDRIFKIA